ncbi:hypothetical protein BDN67DRAFT_460206 [Paxillus ammoniavirescens]|nr:hypothetical protein BDN67DRAFT_460206 [Paxillus ammoniavirescens]
MLDGRLFDKLEALARYVRDNERPFGGIQLILSGDFFQLPPVPDQDSTSRIEATFAFQAKTWHRCVDHMAILTKVFRQKDNKCFPRCELVSWKIGTSRSSGNCVALSTMMMASVQRSYFL